MVEAGALLVGRSDFHRFLPTMSVAEIGARLVDLSDVVCRCSNDDFRREVLDYMLDIASALGEGGEYALPVVVAEVRVGGFVQSGVVCIAPSCICEAIRELWRTDRDLANHVRVAVSPLKKVYDLTKPSEEVELRAVIAGVCRGEGNREVVEAFAKFYIVKKAMENPKFKDEIIAWLKDEERLPRGFIDEFVNYLTSLKIGMSKRTVYRALQEIHLTSRNELLNIFGVKAEGEDVKVHCALPEVVNAILRMLGLQPGEYIRVLCMLGAQEVEELGKLVRDNAEAREKVREFLTGEGASVDGLRELMREYLGAKEVSGEAKVDEAGDEAVVGEVEVRGETGEVGAMPRAEGVGGAPRVRAIGRGEADVEGGGFRGVHRVEVRCFGVNAGATEECRLLNLLAGFINDGDFSVVPEVKRLLDVVVSRRSPNIGGRDGYAAIRGCVDVELRNLGVENGEEVLELITREGSLRELGKALGGSVGDWASLNETILKLARQRARDARSIEAINTLLEIIKALKDLGPEGLGEHSWVIVRVIKAVKDGNWYSLITDLATELELNKEELARHLFGGA
jgi:hypothetical protein